jgi:hypothetical protein
MTGRVPVFLTHPFRVESVTETSNHPWSVISRAVEIVAASVSPFRLDTVDARALRSGR